MKPNAFSDRMVIAVHLNVAPPEVLPPPEANAFGEDALLYPNASIAALLHQAQTLGVEAIAIDETFAGGDFLEILCGSIEGALARGKTPCVMFTVLYYNAARTMGMAADLRKRFGRRVRIVVGGFMARLFGPQYARNADVDVVAVGDAELVMAECLLTDQRMVRGIIAENNLRQLGTAPARPQQTYADLSYESYVGLDARLDRMETFPVGWGATKFTGMRQVCVESLRSCSWAVSNPKGACRFCAASLDLLQVNPRPLEAEFDLHMRLMDRHRVNWVFDVASQWLPYYTPSDCERWLTKYIEVMGKYPKALRDLKKYVYLTAISFNDRVAPLLQEAGVKMAYIGIDHVDVDVLKHMNKPAKKWEHVLQRLDTCQDAGIMFRTALVIGEAETQDTLYALEGRAKDLVSRYNTSMCSLGAFLIEIIPGAHIFDELRKACAHRPEIAEVYAAYDRDGFVPREYQARLTQAYVETYSKVSFADVLAAQQKVVATVSDTYRRCGYYLWFLEGAPKPHEGTAPEAMPS